MIPQGITPPNEKARTVMTRKNARKTTGEPWRCRDQPHAYNLPIPTASMQSCHQSATERSEVADWRQAGIGYTLDRKLASTSFVADWRQAGIGYTVHENSKRCGGV